MSSSTDSLNTTSSSPDTPSSETPSAQPLQRSESMTSKEPILHTCFFDDRPPQSITVGFDSRNDRLFEDKDDYAISGGKGLADQAGYSRQRNPFPQGFQQRHDNNFPLPSLLNKRRLETDQECETTSELLNSLKDKGLTSMRSHTELAKTAHGVRILARRLDKATIHLQLNSVMIITKARDNSLIFLTRELASWLLKESKHTTVYVDFHLKRSKRFCADTVAASAVNGEQRLKFWDKAVVTHNPNLFDFVITLGGDGTVLYASTMFQRAVPPIMSFSLGSLGFLTNFKFEDFRQTLTRAIKHGVKTNLRMRFTCRVHDSHGKLLCEQQVLNELTVDRGPSPWVTMLELYGDGSLITVAQADGLIIATPTGSTAYSLSAGGSLVHPNVSTICVTPICPHTLSFRPILLPDSMTLRVQVPLRARAHAWASFDGRERIELSKGYYVSVSASQYPFPTVRSSKTEYFDSVSSVLNWNKREEQKSFVNLLTDNNKESYGNYKSDSDDSKFEIDYNDESELESDMSEKVKRDLCIDPPAQSDLPKLQNSIKANFFTGTNESTSTSSPDDHL
ncbi:hypothetical protein BRETT_004208 [Brettanomyces bruxellensis]|uniref:NAD(+) kinase n=1 Tax=Dekkera bruxellensis TaxID=5007 RepID=A0A871QZ42_DEKBR|nr:uncharacterized protein BRETT_004208 [Brettanomyces bruxellensis]QOU18987.1 hypothetical protein BRETT_004208 [Brettanomyces bruxellensis]